MPIRSATLADVPQMLRIEQQASVAAHWSPEQYEGLFLPDMPPRTILVATDESNKLKIVGFLVCLSLSEEWEIESVVVDESVRRRGVGSALMREVLSRAIAAGAKALVLEVRESNTPARQLYKKIGFTREACRKDYYQGPLEHAVLYRRTLQFCDKIP